MTDFKEWMIRTLDRKHSENALPGKCMCYYKEIYEVGRWSLIVPPYCPIHGKKEDSPP